MPNTRETVRALVSAFNVHNYARNTVETNFTLQSRGKKDYIVVSFDKSMDTYQCRRYLDSIKRKIIREFYGIEESNDAEILDTAKLIFDVNSFPFYISDRDWSWDEQHGLKFVTPVDEGVIFNLKSHLASSLKKDVLEDMRVSSATIAFKEKKYLWHDEFDNKELCKQFEREFLSRMRERYENVPKKPLKVEGNSVYIKDVFNDAHFIDSVTRYITWLEGMHLEVNSSNNHRVKLLKDMIIRSLYQSTEIMLDGFICAPPLGRKDASILVPVILDDKGARLLTYEEALKLNYAFNNVVLGDLNSKTQAKLSVNGSNVVYGIDFSNPYISHCVITKIIESSVINKDHELSIDPELVRALSPAQSPFNSPTHAGQSGLRTPPNQRKADTDSGYDSNSPPKPKDSGSSSGGPSSGLTELSSPTQEFPTRSQDGALNDSPRRGSEKLLLHNPVNLAGTSIGFWPSTQLSFPTVSQGVSGPSKGGNLGAAAASGSIPGFSSWSQSGASSSRGAGKNMLTGSSSWSVPPSTSPLRNDPVSSNLGIFADPPEDTENICSMKEKQQVTKEKEEENLFKELLYAFNLNNHILECPNTNFIVKDGKIASLIHDSVNVKEYLKELRNSTIEEYYRTEEKAKEACDLNEFPFKFLSNCEKNQETTVVANISSGALFNLKKLFIKESEEEVEIKDIDINIVKEAVKSKKDEWVDSQVKKGSARPREAITTCYPDKNKLKDIPIIKDKGGYCLDRTYSTKEVELFMEERWHAKGKSVAGEGKPEDNNDSDISSGEATDAENVSSKAKATTSGYESMDCENTGKRSPKRKSQSPVGGDSPIKSPKRDSSPLSRLESLSLSSSSHQIGK